MPFKSKFGNSFLPGVLLLVEANSDNVESLCLVGLVSLHNVWHLAAARSAPACPEVNQHIVAFADPLAQFCQLSFGVVHLKVGVFHARLTLAHCLHLLLHSVHHRAVEPYCTRVYEVHKFLVVKVVIHLAHQHGGSHVVLVCLYIGNPYAVCLLLYGVNLLHQFGSLCLASLAVVVAHLLPFFNQVSGFCHEVAVYLHLAKLVV